MNKKPERLPFDSVGQDDFCRGLLQNTVMLEPKTDEYFVMQFDRSMTIEDAVLIIKKPEFDARRFAKAVLQTPHGCCRACDNRPCQITLYIPDGTEPNGYRPKDRKIDIAICRHCDESLVNGTYSDPSKCTCHKRCESVCFHCKIWAGEARDYTWEDAAEDEALEEEEIFQQEETQKAKIREQAAMIAQLQANNAFLKKKEAHEQERRQNLQRCINKVVQVYEETVTCPVELKEFHWYENRLFRGHICGHFLNEDALRRMTELKDEALGHEPDHTEPVGPHKCPLCRTEQRWSPEICFNALADAIKVLREVLPSMQELPEVGAAGAE